MGFTAAEMGELSDEDLPIIEKHVDGTFELQHDDDVEPEEPIRRPVARPKRRGPLKLVFKLGRTVVPSLGLSLIGSVLAGELLHHIKSWTVFEAVPELFVLIPILLNLKGNVELNLASRFSTSSQIGELDIRSTRRTLVLGNLALLQVQALVASLFAAILSFVFGLASRSEGYYEAILVLVSSMASASIATMIVASSLCALIIGSRRLGVDPVRRASSQAYALRTFSPRRSHPHSAIWSR